jgi:hypothetical protein
MVVKGMLDGGGTMQNAECRIQHGKFEISDFRGGNISRVVGESVMAAD